MSCLLIAKFFRRQNEVNQANKPKLSQNELKEERVVEIARTSRQKDGIMNIEDVRQLSSRTFANLAIPQT